MRAPEAAIRELGSSELPVLRLAEVGAIPTEMDVEVSWQAPVLVSFPWVTESENNGRQKKGAEPGREKTSFRRPVCTKISLDYAPTLSM